MNYSFPTLEEVEANEEATLEQMVEFSNQLTEALGMLMDLSESAAMEFAAGMDSVHTVPETTVNNPCTTKIIW